MKDIMKKGILLSIVLLFSLSIVILPSNVYAEVDVKSVSFEETTIIEVTNNSNENINTFRIWLGSDFNFKSFKTEKGWVGEKTPQGVIVFSSSEIIKAGEAVKFGVKTDKVNSGINWKAVDGNDKQINIGKVLSNELPKVSTNPDINPISQSSEGSIKTDSIFRIVPEKPNVGSSIRVTGDQFGTNQEFDFYIDTKKIGSFVTDDDGHFMTTMQIPENQKADRVDFKIKNKVGDEKTISLRIGEIDNRIPESENIKLTIQGIPNTMNRGDFLEIFGTAQPGSAITSEISGPDGNIINTRTAEVDSKGDWELEEPIIVPLDAVFGKYSATISDGRENILKSWLIESDKVIVIVPSSLKFDQGEIMKFNGTALPNKSIEVVIEDPVGKEIFADIIQVDESGKVEFEYQTEQTTLKGTYTVIVTQEHNKEFIYTGVAQLPTIPVNLEFDSLNYKAGDIAEITLSGKASEIISLLIIDPSDKPIGESISITLQPDGRGSHTLDLTGYASGVYTAVISKGSAQSIEIFTVGLQTGSGEIEINTTKLSYLQGDSILLLGDTAANVLLTITLMDPDGNIIKEKETFSDKNGKISESTFRIPSEGKHGMWSINAKSGANFDVIEIEVSALLEEGMIIKIVEKPKLDGINDFINIEISGAAQTVQIKIIDQNENIIETLEFPASSSGEINQPWKLPKEMEPGIYTITAKDAFNVAEMTFVIE
ncbi:MAG: biofilm-associated protein [Thaumarchaeota archaeon]|nr:biofilm-associated protein [Nitrososphaerota archaeon]MBT5843270.1 biofilm-associated protein [Nitrososphaerota archaeon]MBT6468882.1 biofilm-associated protein [Nitrososphaerota archaeon]